MMVNCPKCGFTQPRDQYCANCGVDMVAFQPVGKPFRQRLFANTTFQIGVLVVLAGGGFAIMRQHNKTTLADRIAEIENARTQQIVEKRNAVAQSPPQQALQAAASRIESQPKAVETVPAAAPPALNVADTSTTLSASSVEATSAKADAAPPTEPPPAPSPASAASAASTPASALGAAAVATASNVRIVFAEAQNAILGEVFSEARNSASIGPLNFAVVSNLETRLKAAQANGDWKILDSSAAEPLKVNQPVKVYKGARDEASGKSLGFTVQVTSTLQDDNGTHMQLQILRVLRDLAAAPPIEEFNLPLPEMFIVPTGSSIVLAGSLPRKQLTEQDKQLYQSVDVLRVLASDPFKAGTTDFVILIEPK